ncbi:hypothetical protein BN2537_1501 [Streptomyces venezuelae]|nr:hypothetical protein BN2537_1501 [Streptomyces venezuelae]
MRTGPERDPAGRRAALSRKHRAGVTQPSHGHRRPIELGDLRMA